MELINRYVYAVTKRLPQAQREDIENELRGLIEDMLQERCSGAEPKKADIEAVLQELGEPSQLADKYRGTKRYLIGPEFFDLYLLVLKIVLAVVAFGVGLGKTIELFVNTPPNVAQGFGELLSDIISSVFSAFAWVTIIFVINEQVRMSKNINAKKSKWHPSQLPEIPSSKAIIKRSEPIAGIVFSVLFIILFNFASHLMGAYYLEAGEIQSVIPIFSPEGLRQFLPLITVGFSISILKECIKLIVGKWTLSLGVTNAVLNLAVLIFCAVIFSTPAVWNANFVSELYTSGLASADASNTLQSLWNGFTKSFIYVIALGLIVDSIVSVYKGIKYKVI